MKHLFFKSLRNFIVLMALASGVAKAESYIRFRGYQPSPLLSESTEKGNYQVGSEKNAKVSIQGTDDISGSLRFT